MKVVTIVGARPQFIKAAMVSRAIAARNRAASTRFIEEEIIHTGQHFDANMSEVFFKQMGIPAPAANLGISGGSHGEMTGRMLAAIEAEILARKPDQVMVYGDTNSTLAGALAAAKLHIPVSHVEAGLRSFNRRMPEEINRVLTDHLSFLLFCPTHTAVENLAREGITRSVHHVGDVMYDAALFFGKIADTESTVLGDNDLISGQYLLVTVHRAENTDNPLRLESILSALQRLSEDWTVVFPVHPRTGSKISASGFSGSEPSPGNLKCIAPVCFLDMVQLEKNARCILTDSGGVQKEAYFHSVPCVTLREETEWVETVTAGWNQVVGVDTDRICQAVRQASCGGKIQEYGNGRAAESIISLLATS